MAGQARQGQRVRSGEGLRIFPVSVCYALRMVDDELEDEAEPLPPEDPMRAIKRLAQAVIVQALIDFTRAHTRAEDREVWSDASRFLFPDDPDQQEFLRWTVEVSALDPYRLRANLTRMAGRWSYRARSGR
jgi:hypothetical protein